ncbi:hypothetical protein MMC25_001744 [Agyrium rufum]|nr:hypothetical protein [Agyrium rufum]
MHSLNPFLRAFFKSSLPAQCNPVNQHSHTVSPKLRFWLRQADVTARPLKILLVPTTEVLLTSKDRETGSLLTDLVPSEEFLASHVLRIPDSSAAGQSKELGTVRENRNKAKPFPTINGRMVVIKESHVYSNKGFRNLNQVQLLSDALYYNDGLEAQQWLIYYISKPLIGSIEPIKITPALVPQIIANARSVSTPSTSGSAQHANDSNAPNTPNTPGPVKKDIRSFGDLLAQFPMIARQMQSGLEKVFKDFHRDISKPLPSPHGTKPSNLSRRSSVTSSHSGNGSIHSMLSSKWSKSASMATTYAEDEEDHMRRTLENAVTSAIDLFQQVDKQQLSLLGASTELTGPLVERLIEKYIAEQVHMNTLFPRLCEIRKIEDMELETCIHHMAYIDVAQVGIEIEGGRQGKLELTRRLTRGIEEFKKLVVAGNPQEMMDILLATQKALAMPDAPQQQPKTQEQIGSQTPVLSEKSNFLVTMNADTLVSLLLVVVIRSQIHHLQARLAYMRGFIFIDDVESGEMGYALSTFEAVLSYLASDPGGLKTASRRNRKLWQAIKRGNMDEMKAILEPDSISFSDDDDLESSLDEHERSLVGFADEATNGDVYSKYSRTDMPNDMHGANLAHVFPFQAANRESPLPNLPKAQKRVSMDLRSLSSSSEFSFHSRSTDVESRTAGIEGDTSIEKLCQTEDSSGDSVLMMAVEARQPDALEYLLSLEEYFPLQVVLDDQNSDGSTLLSASIQLAHQDLIAVMVEYVLQMKDLHQLHEYLCKPDKRGRTMAHYLFNAPHLIRRFGTLLPWRWKDKFGQTPLLALCRSYDHPHYAEMVNDALECALEEQDDRHQLHVDYHIDAKGNTLLHVVSEPYLALRILQHCDVDPNAPNNKQFTPLMVASKFGRFDLIRAMFLDKRVDIQAKEFRGMTAVELAKDDEVRNRIDDMILVSNSPAPDGRVTAVVRSFFVEDATIRLIIKSGVRSGNGLIAITTCKRSLADFEKLAKWLSIEHPASWLPSIFNFRSPFQIPSKPSRAVLHDIQVRLNKFLRIMLLHSTFSQHELLWEFILLPEIHPEMMAERVMKKADLNSEHIREDFEPVEDVRDVETFVGHARESIRGVNHSTKSVMRRVNGIRNAQTDLSTSLNLLQATLTTLPFLPQAHLSAFYNYAHALAPAPASDPFIHLHTDFLAIHTTILAILSSLSRPHALIAQLQASQKNIDRIQNSMRRADRWPVTINVGGFFDDTKGKIMGSGNSDATKRKQQQQQQLARNASTASNVPKILAPNTTNQAAESNGNININASNNNTTSKPTTSTPNQPLPPAAIAPPPPTPPQPTTSSTNTPGTPTQNDRLATARREKRELGQELRYTQSVVAGELAGWQEAHGKMVGSALRQLVRGVVQREKGRLEGLKRAVRILKESEVRVLGPPPWERFERGD